jgi:hypothetical protein
MQKWEYLIGERWLQHGNKSDEWKVRANDKYYSSMTDMLNELGEQGWELVGVASRWQTYEYHLFLKRPME